MTIGIEINRGGNNKITGGSINVKDPDGKAIVVNDSFGNEVKDVEIILESSLEKFREIRNIVSNIQDNSINPRTSNTYKDDVLSKLPSLTQSKNEIEVNQISISLISLLSSWITIKTELAIILDPSIQALTVILGG